ncbi:MAG: ECF transporter S component [Deltaproteobacteria bacterium]|nr:ECF transporter S component [Deltaproteobacteria bacterium]MBW2611472.1 ECF transporter S component [Deltaproteobacteria bacterium]MBW2634384.1 ECF transporter S component [Deltaproteobacteria bacterium]MBW2678005.1 ECF transporter S component [Deltaproteobacteria bacterium]
MKKNEWTFATTAIVAGLIALSAIATMVIRIPIPATTGYFNIGDVFVVLAGLWLGPLAGALVGGLGPTIADAIGFPVFIPATMVTKGLEGFLVGLIASRAQGSSMKLRTVAAFVGGLTVVVGYFVFEAYIYPAMGKSMPAFAVTDIGAAIVEAFPNTVQGIIGAVGGLALWKALSGYQPGKK